MPAVRALIVTAGFLALAGIASAAQPQPKTIAHTPAPVKALTQDGGMLAWLSGDGKKCNVIHVIGGGHTYVMPQPPNASMTCHWNISDAHLALASGANAALWTLHEGGSDLVMTAEVGGKEVEVDRLAHADGTGWWLGGTAGGGSTLAYSAIDVEYVHPLGCGSGGSCKKKVAGGGIDLVTAGQKAALPGAGPAMGLAISNGRVAYIPATAVAKDGAPVSSPGARIPIVDVANGTVVSEAKAIGVPLAIGFSPHVLAVLSRTSRALRLVWYNPSTGHKVGEAGVPAETAPVLAVDNQFVVYRFGRSLRALVIATRHPHPLGKTAPQYLGLSLDEGRLVWAENRRSSGAIRALTLR